MKKLSILFVLLVVGLTAQLALGQGEKMSDKEMLIKATQILEKDPFYEKAKDFRAWAMTYVIQTDDVSITVCLGSLFEAVMDKKNKYSSELLAQYSLSMAAFKLSNPDKAKDEDAAQLAGLESMLRAYEAMVKAKPKAQFAGMDDIIKKRDNGELKKIVEDAKCGSGKTEPIK